MTDRVATLPHNADAAAVARVAYGNGPLVEACDLWKRFGRRIALQGINIAVSPGRTLVIIGPNGAGKSTILRVLATLTRPSSGTVRLCGIESATDPVAVRRRLGVVLSATMLYPELSGAENLRHYARLYGVPAASARIGDVARLVDLEERVHDRVSSYSRGMSQRLAIARALLHGPEVLLLDEPDAGLDPEAIGRLPEILRDDGPSHRAIVMTCHDIALALRLGDDVAILVDGRFVFAAPATSLRPAQLQDAFARAVAGTLP